MFLISRKMDLVEDVMIFKELFKEKEKVILCKKKLLYDLKWVKRR